MPTCNSPSCDCNRRTYRRVGTDRLIVVSEATRTRLLRNLAKFTSNFDLVPRGKDAEWEYLQIEGIGRLVRIADGSLYVVTGGRKDMFVPMGKKSDYVKNLYNYFRNLAQREADRICKRKEAELAAAKAREEAARQLTEDQRFLDNVKLKFGASCRTRLLASNGQPRTQRVDITVLNCDLRCVVDVHPVCPHARGNRIDVNAQGQIGQHDVTVRRPDVGQHEGGSRGANHIQ